MQMINRMPATMMIAVTLFFAGCLSDEPGPSEDVAMEDPASEQGDAMEEAITFSGTASNVIGTGVPTVQCPADAVNSQSLVWSITAPPGSSGAHVTDMVITIQGSPTVNDADVFVTGPDGSAKGSATGSTASESVTLSGRQPIGDWSIEVRGCSGVGDVQVTGQGTLHWTPASGA